MILIRDYFAPDFDLVRDVVRNRVPELRSQIATIFKTWHPNGAAAAGATVGPPQASA